MTLSRHVLMCFVVAFSLTETLLSVLPVCIYGQRPESSERQVGPPKEAILFTGADIIEALSQKSDVEKVNISGLEITNYEFGFLKDFRKLRHLAVARTGVTSVGLRVLDNLTQLETLSLQSLPIDDTAAPHFSRLTRLRVFSCQDARIGDEVVKQVARSSPGLIEINVAGTLITDAGLEALAGLGRVETLRISATSISDDGIQALRRIKSLRSIDLSETKITDRSMSVLGLLPNLERIEAYGNRVSNSGVASLKPATRLLRLGLSATDVNSHCRRDLQELTALQDLSLSETAVGDEIIETLVGMKGLHEVNLERTRISAGGVERLRRAAPHLRVKWRSDPQRE